MWWIVLFWGILILIGCSLLGWAFVPCVHPLKDVIISNRRRD
jgi:hypothetical protein